MGSPHHHEVAQAEDEHGSETTVHDHLHPVPQGGEAGAQVLGERLQERAEPGRQPGHAVEPPVLGRRRLHQLVSQHHGADGEPGQGRDENDVERLEDRHEAVGDEGRGVVPCLAHALLGGAHGADGGRDELPVARGVPQQPLDRLDLAGGLAGPVDLETAAEHRDPEELDLALQAAEQPAQHERAGHDGHERPAGPDADPGGEVDPLGAEGVVEQLVGRGLVGEPHPVGVHEALDLVDHQERHQHGQGDVDEAPLAPLRGHHRGAPGGQHAGDSRPRGSLPAAEVRSAQARQAVPADPQHADDRREVAQRAQDQQELRHERVPLAQLDRAPHRAVADGDAEQAERQERGPVRHEQATGGDQDPHGDT